MSPADRTPPPIPWSSWAQASPGGPAPPRRSRWWCWPSAELSEGATAWAQGGIVGVLGSDDSIDSHVRDTLDAGAGLVEEHTARYIAQNSAEAVEWLVEARRAVLARPGGARWACT